MCICKNLPFATEARPVYVDIKDMVPLPSLLHAASTSILGAHFARASDRTNSFDRKIIICNDSYKKSVFPSFDLIRHESHDLRDSAIPAQVYLGAAMMEALFVYLHITTPPRKQCYLDLTGWLG